jgi:rubredoxin
MAERVLKGSRLGTTSYETDRNTDLAPRHEAVYDCPHGHVFTVPLSADAEAPATWDCRSCGSRALLRDGELPEPKAGKTARTHWDMLIERRAELHELQRGQKRSA